MQRLMNRTVQGVLDLAVLSVAYWLAFFLRFDGHLPFQMWKRLMFTWPYVLILEYGVLSAFAIPRFSWRHMGLRETTRVLWATGTVAGILLVLRFAAAAAARHWGYAQYFFVPIGIVAANFALSFLGIVGIRASRRLVGERASAGKLDRTTRHRTPTLLVGAGDAGALVAREIARRPDLAIAPVGFLDDDRRKHRTIIHGIPVLGAISDLEPLAARLGASQVLVTIADIDPAILRSIVRECEKVGLPAKVIPGLYQVIEGNSQALQLRDVSVEDLLGRETVTLELDLIRGFLSGQCVLVTGAGGSIGAELCRQVARFAPGRLVLVEQSEFALFTIQQELRRSYPKLSVCASVCDVTDAERVEVVFRQERPNVVFHAAAHKHVPMMEENPGEAIKNNIFGTRTVANAADQHGVGTFVFISTDKAVNPSSIMGATKRVSEMYVQSLSTRSNTKFVAVRFGNVLGSAGSVIPTFKAQIAAGGPVTVTHPEMRRYFMTIPEATQLVMQASAMGKGGEIFVLDMGQPVKIVDLASDLIRLSGLVPGEDVGIVFSGLRPGEKLYEEFSFDAERMSKTGHPKVYIGKLVPSDYSELCAKLESLIPLRNCTSTTGARESLRQLVPEMLEPDHATVSRDPSKADVNPRDTGDS